jgi:hypothetical protein
MDSNIEHKNTYAAIRYCKIKNLEYDLIADSNYYNFLEKISMNDKFVFFPKTPETLCRVIVEARMMNIKIITNDKIGASKEEWFSLRGVNLIEKMTEKRKEIIDVVLECLTK